MKFIKRIYWLIHVKVCWWIIRYIKDTKRAADFKIRCGLAREDLEPIRCFNCGTVKYEDEITDGIGSITLEQVRKCKACGTKIGYWSTGYWLP